MSGYSKTAWPGVSGGQTTSAGATTGRRTSPAARTVNEASAEFLEAAERGSARDRYGRPFSPEAIGELRWCLTGHVSDRLGAMPLSRVSRHDVEALVDDLARAGISRRRLRAIVKSLRALYDYAEERDLVANNPADKVALPDEDDAEQPARGRPPARPQRVPQLLRLPQLLRIPQLREIGFDRALQLGMQVATVCFALLALFFIAESL